ncbi:unnamed protein product [Rangifer tarandus platyrhynchus]|uniref:Uncharacterized protein n=1 Tax=Rangifer tarandus platyrhynchus TaxID=3082113 RepID=A0ABN8YU30_RANTA|nr:unnamed protein product [Rangifer tarandus platyrhynchus]
MPRSPPQPISSGACEGTDGLLPDAPSLGLVGGGHHFLLLHTATRALASSPNRPSSGFSSCTSLLGSFSSSRAPSLLPTPLGAAPLLAAFSTPPQGLTQGCFPCPRELLLLSGSFLSCSFFLLSAALWTNTPPTCPSLSYTPFLLQDLCTLYFSFSFPWVPGNLEFTCLPFS